MHVKSCEMGAKRFAKLSVYIDQRFQNNYILNSKDPKKFQEEKLEILKYDKDYREKTLDTIFKASLEDPPKDTYGKLMRQIYVQNMEITITTASNLAINNFLQNDLNKSEEHYHRKILEKCMR